MKKLSDIRNIGISAHIDSGKTTLTERMLFYCGRIHRMGEVKGKDGGATMDYMDLEKERGITITSAATAVRWTDKDINIIDTPGHVDFTVEVERSLRVLDGAVLVLCAVGGVQSQSITVDRQMRRYRVPRIAFINKMDRTGADPARVVSQLETKLGHVAVPLHIPIGEGATYDGNIDLVAMKAVYFEGPAGEQVRTAEIPEHLVDEANRARQGMLDTLSLYDDELMEVLLEGIEPSVEQLHRVIRTATLSRDITPVLLGTAYRNKGVQSLLDAVSWYLPSPIDRVAYACDNENEGAEITMTADVDAPLTAMAFKISDESFGQVTYVRVYQGKMEKGKVYRLPRNEGKARIGRLFRFHADKREELDAAFAGDIVGITGIDCISGDTICDPSINLSLESIHVPEPVISISVNPARSSDRDSLSRALTRFVKEDPTFHARFDDEAGETILSGMGELHLEVYIERMKREYKVEVVVGQPKVSYREAPTVEAKYDYKHRKQTGGSGQYAHVVGTLIPTFEQGGTDYEFENKVTGGRIPTEYIPSVDKGFQMARGKGPVAGYEVVGVKMILEDGSSHAVDSSDLAFQLCARTAFRKAVESAKPALLEPIMNVEIESPTEFQGTVSGDIASRRGMITGSDARGLTVVLSAEVPLANMFGYATNLRSMTQGQATFSMEFGCYRRTPASVQAEIVAKIEEAKKAAAKK